MSTDKFPINTRVVAVRDMTSVPKGTYGTVTVAQKYSDVTVAWDTGVTTSAWHRNLHPIADPLAVWSALGGVLRASASPSMREGQRVGTILQAHAGRFSVAHEHATLSLPMLAAFVGARDGARSATVAIGRHSLDFGAANDRTRWTDAETAMALGRDKAWRNYGVAALRKGAAWVSGGAIDTMRVRAWSEVALGERHETREPDAVFDATIALAEGVYRGKATVTTKRTHRPRTAFLPRWAQAVWVEFDQGIATPTGVVRSLIVDHGHVSEAVAAFRTKVMAGRPSEAWTPPLRVREKAGHRRPPMMGPLAGGGLYRVPAEDGPTAWEQRDPLTGAWSDAGMRRRDEWPAGADVEMPLSPWLAAAVGMSVIGGVAMMMLGMGGARANTARL